MTWNNKTASFGISKDTHTPVLLQMFKLVARPLMRVTNVVKSTRSFQFPFAGNLSFDGPSPPEVG